MVAYGMNKPLTRRQRDIASVAADLLCKGSPITRIIQYARKQGMTDDQIRVFTYKLQEYGVNIHYEILSTLYLLSTQGQDNYVFSGGKLRKKLDEDKRTKK